MNVWQWLGCFALTARHWDLWVMSFLKYYMYSKLKAKSVCTCIQPYWGVTMRFTNRMSPAKKTKKQYLSKMYQSAGYLLLFRLPLLFYVAMGLQTRLRGECTWHVPELLLSTLLVVQFRAWHIWSCVLCCCFQVFFILLPSWTAENQIFGFRFWVKLCISWHWIISSRAYSILCIKLNISLIRFEIILQLL